MASVVFTFDEQEDRNDITVIANRQLLLNAINNICNLRRRLYKGYMNKSIILKDNKIVEKNGEALESYDSSGLEEYIETEYIISELDDIIDDVNFLLD